MRSQPTRVWLLLCILALGAIVATLVVLATGDGAGPPVPPADPASAVGDPPAAPAPPPAAGTPAPASQEPAAPVVGSTVATRVAATVPGPTDLADRPTACIQVFDRDSKRAVAGAFVRRVQGGAEVAFTDERGLASVPLKQPEQLAVFADGYFLRMVPTQLGSTEAEPQRVVMVRDDWSIRRVVEFSTDSGLPIEEVLVRLRPAPGGRPSAPEPPPGDALVARAWSEHLTLARLPVGADALVQLAEERVDHVHRLGRRSEVRFVQPGDYVLEAATPNGLFGSARFHLQRAAGAAATIAVALRRGDFVVGTATTADRGRPLAEVRIEVAGGDPLGLVATTGSDGRFRLGPLLPGQLTLLARHRDHESLSFGPVRSDAGGVKLLLQALPTGTLRGRVSSRPDGQPIASATVAWAPGTPQVSTTTTGADGTFVLRTNGTGARQLAVTAPGFVTYGELVEPGAPFAEFGLLPATTEARLAARLTGVLQGVVQDASGRPVVGAGVRWTPGTRSEAVGLPGRRVLEGAVLELPAVVASGPDGAFRLETTHFGAGRLALVDGDAFVDTEVRAGTETSGLRLRR